MGDFDCDNCSKQYATRSGLWKHKKKCGVEEIEEVQPVPIEAGESADRESYDNSDYDGDLPPVSGTDWSDFTFDDSDETTTESIPPILKAIKAKDPKASRKLTKVEQKARDGANESILVMGLSGVDYAITKYGQAVTENPEYECSHSQADKTLVANAQLAYLKESGIDLSQHIGTGKVAAVLTGYYIVPPIVKIRSESKRSLLPKIGLKLRLPRLRFWRRKSKPRNIDEVE